MEPATDGNHSGVRCTAATFFNALFRPSDGYIELRALPSRRRAFIEPGNMAAIESFISAHKTEDLYFGVAARRDSSGGRLENCSVIRAAFADLDFKDFRSEADAVAALEHFPLVPSFCIRSGGGLHVYWVLIDPIDLQVDAVYFNALLKGIARVLGADTSSAEAARILRIPGTKNFKPQYSTPPAVTIEEVKDSTYSISDFEFLTREQGQVSSSNGNNRQGTFEGEDRLRRARTYIRAMPGAVQGNHGDDATYKAALAMRDFGLTEAECFDLLAIEYNPRCSPEWSDEELRAKIHNAYRYGKGALGSKLDQEPPLDAGRQRREHDEDSDMAMGVSLEDFYAHMPTHSYIFAPTRELWPASSVNARIPRTPKATTWLDMHRPVEQITWAPGEPMVIRDRLTDEGGWIDRLGVSCFNLYRPPKRIPGSPAQAAPWIEHVRYVYGADSDHIILWFAHRVQRPYEKINHALVLGGLQGIGKDTLLEPVKHAVGPWNFHEVSPTHLLGRFNGWVKSVILRINEARDLGDVDRYSFYDHLKAYTAAPPDVLRCDEKNIKE